MTRARVVCLAVLLLAALFAARAGADVRYTAPHVEWAGPLPHATAGQPLHGAFLVCSCRPGIVADIRIEGDGWSARLLDPRPHWAQSGGRTDTVRFEATPTDPDRPLRVRFTLDGVEQSAPLDLSPARLEALRRPGRLVRLEQGGPARVAPAPGEVRAAPAPPVEDGTWKRAPHVSPAGAQGTANSRQIQVHGQLAYRRPDGKAIGADGVTVRVYDENLALNTLLGSTTTATDGTFSVTFLWDPLIFLEEWPDVFVEFEAASDHALTRSTDFSFWGYTWRTGTERDYQGFEIDLGTWVPADDAAALCIQTDLVRDWRWYHEHLATDLPRTIGIWPDNSSSVSFYAPVLREVHINANSQWDEATHAHEFGHGFMDNLHIWDVFDYCNGVCDPPGECGHCMWCEETESVGFQEGVPDYLAYLQSNDYGSRYGVAAEFTEDAEHVDSCGPTATLGDPYRTEGFTLALLQDITDSSNETDSLRLGQCDRLSLGYDEILSVLMDHKPHTLWEFLGDFQTHLTPTDLWSFWATAENCHIERDFFKPPAPANLTSPTNPVGGTSTDATPKFTWTYPADDLSGPKGVEYSIETSSTMTRVDGYAWHTTTFTSGVLAPGTWYFHVRTVDESGKISDAATSYGPFTIHAADPLDFLADTPAGWSGPIVPRPAADATLTSVPAPASLAGNAASTYWNVAGRNAGGQLAAAGLDARLIVDGADGPSTTWSTAIGPGAGYAKVNLGPVTVRGGRHTFGVLHDSGEEFAEQSEINNDIADQLVWSPYTLSAGTGVIRTAPPDRTGGWDALPIKHSRSYNCDGFRFSASAAGGWWQAVYVCPNVVDDDYDCRLHNATSSPDSGFSGLLASSARPAGCLDAVILNRNNVGTPDLFDVGVTNVSGGSGSFTVRQEASAYMDVGDSVGVSLPTGQMLLLREFFADVHVTGPVSVSARIVSGDGPVRLAVYDASLTTGGLLQSLACATTEYMTTARIDIASPAGYHAIALYRDPQDGTGWVNLVLQLKRTPPDLVPYAAAGWHSPLVPRPAFDGTAGSVPAPDTLYGNVASTYLNAAERNQSIGSATATSEARIHLDGTDLASLYFPPLAGGATALRNWNPAFTVTGGRHTLGMQLDPLDALGELDEGNNGWGEQWVWSPAPLVLDSLVMRPAPPLRTGGWDDVTTFSTDLRYNCDGTRTPVFHNSGDDGYWGGVAVAPGPASDVDLRLYELQRGPTAGFLDGMCSSAWGMGQTELAIADFNCPPFRAFDVGVTRSSGTEDYGVETVRSIYRGGVPSGSLGPFTIGARHLLHLHEFYLPAGSYLVTVEPVSGSVDWGVSVYQGGTPCYGKSDTPAKGCAWLEGPGVLERVGPTLENTDYHCVAVWKAMSSDAAKIGSYRLTLVPYAADAPGTPPGRTLALSVAPNPSRAGAQVRFDLATEAEVSLDVYNVNGARVATLAGGHRAAGSHRVTWSGAGRDGRDLPPGLYLVRLEAGGRRTTCKLVKLE